MVSVQMPTKWVQSGCSIGCWFRFRCFRDVFWMHGINRVICTIYPSLGVPRNQSVFTLTSYRSLIGPSFLVEEAMSTVGKLLVYGLEGGFIFLVLVFLYWQVFGESPSETS